jgi:predicted DNA-binding protein YlxM (UPF0122 family)
MKYDQCVNKILNGLAKNKSTEDIAKKHKVSKKKIEDQIKQGTSVEKEHTKNKTVAKTIAKDHVFEKPKYYTDLKKIEKKVDKK